MWLNQKATYERLAIVQLDNTEANNQERSTGE